MDFAILTHYDFDRAGGVIMQDGGGGLTITFPNARHIVRKKGGHNRGHQIVRIESQGRVALHLADLLRTHAHFNPPWVMAYDNFPLEAITQKETWEIRGIEENAWFTFYHDPFVFACKFDEQGNVIDRWDIED
jgi:glyoxylase-like metal-dependent hydrolase (beta-lactamase superfamily II)